MPDRSTKSILFMSNVDENPYSELLRGSLSEKGVKPIPSNDVIILPILRNLHLNTEVDAIQLDWLYPFYMVEDYTGYKILDDALTFLRSILFLVELAILNHIQTPVVWTVHNKQHHENKYPKIEKVLNEITFYVAEVATVKCDNARNIINEKYRMATEEMLEVVPDGNYIDAYENNVDKKTARCELDIDENEFVYLFFGMIREYKGIPELIQSFDRLSMPNSKLLIVGSPKTEEIRYKIERMSEGNDSIRTVCDFIRQDDVQYYLNAADTLVLPYKDILNSGSVHLGLSFGVPIIAPKMGCIPAVVPEENDLLYNPRGEQQLESVLRDANQRENLESIGEANHQRAIRLSWDKTAEMMKGIYEF